MSEWESIATRFRIDWACQISRLLVEAELDVGSEHVGQGRASYMASLEYEGGGGGAGGV